jgi:hypothetical protein
MKRTLRKQRYESYLSAQNISHISGILNQCDWLRVLPFPGVSLIYYVIWKCHLFENCNFMNELAETECIVIKIFGGPNCRCRWRWKQWRIFMCCWDNASLLLFQVVKDSNAWWLGEFMKISISLCIGPTLAIFGCWKLNILLCCLWHSSLPFRLFCIYFYDSDL